MLRLGDRKDLVKQLEAVTAFINVNVRFSRFRILFSKCILCVEAL